MPNHFSWRKVLKKKELNLQIVKISGRKTETTDNKFHDFFSRIGKKRKTKMNTIDFNKVFWKIVSTQSKSK